VRAKLGRESGERYSAQRRWGDAQRGRPSRRKRGTLGRVGRRTMPGEAGVAWIMRRRGHRRPGVAAAERGARSACSRRRDREDGKHGLQRQRIGGKQRYRSMDGAAHEADDIRSRGAPPSGVI
jgi:hypothetical protein